MTLNERCAMTLNELRALANEFFEWPESSDGRMVSTISALLFAQHVLQLREKSLATEDSAGVYALRDAAQQALKALEWHLDCGTWGADLDGCAAALRAALEQQVEPEPVAWVRLESWKSGEEWPDDCFTAEKSEGLTPLYTAPPQRKPLTDEEIVEAVREADLDWQAGWTLDEHEPNRFTTLARAIERAHGIGEENK